MAVYRLPLRESMSSAPRRITRDDRFWRAGGRYESDHASAAALLLGSGIVLGSMFAFNYFDSPRSHLASMAPTGVVYEVVSPSGGSR